MVVEGLMETAERKEEANAEEEFALFVDRFRHLTHMILDEDGSAIGWYTSEVRKKMFCFLFRFLLF